MRLDMNGKKANRDGNANTAEVMNMQHTAHLLLHPFPLYVLSDSCCLLLLFDSNPLLSHS